MLRAAAVGLFEHATRYLKMHVWRERGESLLSVLKRCDPSRPGCQWSVQEGSNGARGSKDSRGGRESAAEPNPQRFLAVSLCLLTLSYTIDFFINPLSKCFSLPHSSDISPTPFFPPQDPGPAVPPCGQIWYEGVLTPTSKYWTFTIVV